MTSVGCAIVVIQSSVLTTLLNYFLTTRAYQPHSPNTNQNITQNCMSLITSPFFSKRRDLLLGTKFTEAKPLN